MAVDRNDWTTDAVKVGRACAMDAAESRQCSLLFNALSSRSPVQHITKYRCVVPAEWSVADEARCLNGQLTDSKANLPTPHHHHHNHFTALFLGQSW